MSCAYNGDDAGDVRKDAAHQTLWFKLAWPRGAHNRLCLMSAAKCQSLRWRNNNWPSPRHGLPETQILGSTKLHVAAEDAGSVSIAQFTQILHNIKESVLQRFVSKLCAHKNGQMHHLCAVPQCGPTLNPPSS